MDQDGSHFLEDTSSDDEETRNGSDHNEDNDNWLLSFIGFIGHLGHWSSWME